MAVAVALLLLAEAVARAATAGTPAPLRWYDAAAELRVAMMAERGQADVVVAGTSMAWQGLLPSAFTAADAAGRSAFNAGLPGGVPTVTGPWLTDVVVPALDPDVVLWGLSSLDLAPAYGAAELDAWHASPEGRPGPLGALERSAARASALVEHRSQLRRPSTALGDARAALAADRAQARADTGPDGERTVEGEGLTARGADVQRARLAGFAPDPADVRAVVSTTLDLRRRGVEVVLVELPVPPALVALHPRGAADVETARAVLTALAAELGVAHVPLTGVWSDADFVDHTHLAPASAARLTAQVADALDRTTAAVAAGADPVTTAALREWVGDDTATTVLRPLRQAAISQVGCLGQAVPEADRAAAAAALARLDDPVGRPLLESVLAAADAVAGACTSRARWDAAMADLLRAAEPAARHLEANLVAPGPPTADGAVAAALAAAPTSRDLAALVVHAYERLNWLLEGAGDPRLSRHELWWSYGERAHVAALDADAAAGATADTVVLGTSQARVGVDADLLGQLLGVRAVDAAIDGATVDVTRHWAPFAVDRARPRRVVVGVSGFDLYATEAPCPTTRRDRFLAATATARSAFAGVPWLDGVPPLAITADARRDAPLQSPLVAAWPPTPEQDHPVLTEAEVLGSGAAYLAAYARATPCEDRLATLGELVGELAAAGVEVVVVSMPVRGDLRAAAPAGAVEALDARVAQVVAAAGGRHLTYTGLLLDEGMADLVHPTALGAEAVTRRLAEDLAR